MSADQAARPIAVSRSPRPVLAWVLGALAAAALLGGGAWFIQDANAALRERPLTAACQTNLRRIGQGIQMYAQDYNETLPVSASGRGDVVALLAPYTGQQFGKGIWRCPGQVPFSSGNWTSSYGYNWQYLLKPGPDYPHQDWNGIENPALQLSEIARPGSTVMFIDHKPPPGNASPQLWSFVVRPGQSVRDPYAMDGMGVVDPRHRGRANVLFCDGHVKDMGSEIRDEARYWSPK